MLEQKMMFGITIEPQFILLIGLGIIIPLSVAITAMSAVYFAKKGKKSWLKVFKVMMTPEI